MTEPTPGQKMLANIRHLRSRGASRERIQQEIDYWRGELQRQSADERKLTVPEKFAAAGSKAASGLTFGGFDELAGLVGGEGAKDTQRFLQNQFQDEHPVLATGAEIVGSLAMPGTFLAPAARTASLGAKALRVVGEGAIQGGLSAIGNAEGSLAERLDDGLMGAGLGAGTAGVIGGAAKLASKTLGRAAERVGWTPRNPQRALERLADDTPETDIAAARAKLAEFTGRKLGEEVMVADVLPKSEAALRMAGTQNREARSLIDQRLRERSNRLSNLAEDRFSAYTGTQPRSARRTVDQMMAEARDRARPLYEAAEQQADAARPIELPAIQTAQSPPKSLRDALREFDERKVVARSRAEGTPDQQRLRRSLEERSAQAERPAIRGESVPRTITKGGVDPLDIERVTLINKAVEQPNVAGYVQRVKRSATYAELPATDHRVMDQAYKEIGEDIRVLREKRSARTITTAERRELSDLIDERKQLKAAIEARASMYGNALESYADDMAIREAFELGATKNTPSDLVPVEMAELSAVQQPFYREGKATTLRPKTTNPDLGEFARFRDVLEVFSDPERAATFRTTFGPDKYREYLKDLLSMARMQRLRGGAGESTTVDKLVEQMENDPEKVASLFRSITSGNPVDIFSQMARYNKVLERLSRSKGAKANAEFLLQRGEGSVNAALDVIARLVEEGKRSPGRNFRKPSPVAASARVVGGATGRP